MKFSIPRSDLILETFRCGGKGGQNQNKVESGVRITHKPSGAVGECREERAQFQNRRKALKKLVESKKFLTWAKIHLAMLEQGYKDIENKVSYLMKPENLQIELGCDKCKPNEAFCDKTNEDGQ